MFTAIFFTIIKVFVVPASAIFMLSNTFVGYQLGFLGVSITITIILIPMIIWQAIKIFPNLALLKTKNILKLAVQILIEVVGVIAFWVIYFSMWGA